MSDAIEKYVTHIKVSVLQEEIRTLRAELEAMKQERDEMRKVAERWRDEAVLAGGSWSLPSGGLLPWEDEG